MIVFLWRLFDFATGIRFLAVNFAVVNAKQDFEKKGIRSYISNIVAGVDMQKNEKILTNKGEQ